MRDDVRAELAAIRLELAGLRAQVEGGEAAREALRDEVSYNRKGIHFLGAVAEATAEMVTQLRREDAVAAALEVYAHQGIKAALEHLRAASGLPAEVAQ